MTILAVIFIIVCLYLFLLRRYRIIWYEGSLSEFNQKIGCECSYISKCSDPEKGRIVIDSDFITYEIIDDLLRDGCIGFITVRKQEVYARGWSRILDSNGLLKYESCRREHIAFTGIPVKRKDPV